MEWNGRERQEDRYLTFRSGGLNLSQKKKKKKNKTEKGKQ